ncbi:hypothetical protein PR048_003189 [Dryococelus australis]|uniref:Uncharacterized protein n=1 Tax=Dryococelus australis TaxID=614101 RepID=A0ABQ9IME8_9NEOP|nr:hypothetical protein PR048_003189 [Dryococelus australis]
MALAPILRAPCSDSNLDNELTATVARGVRHAPCTCNAGFVSHVVRKGRGGLVVRLLASHLGELSSTPVGAAPDLRMYKSYRTMLLVGDFVQGSPVPPSLAFRRHFILASLQPHRLSRPRCLEPPKSLHLSRAFKTYNRYENARDCEEEAAEAAGSSVGWRPGGGAVTARRYPLPHDRLLPPHRQSCIIPAAP